MLRIILMTETVLCLALMPACEGCFDVGPTDAGPSEGEGEGEGEGEPPSGLSINEVMASNTRTLEDSTGAFPDWIEIKNLDAEDKDLGGYFLSDNPDDPERMEIPAGTSIEANGYLVVFCDGDIDQSTPTEPHAPFRLSSNGEALRLADADGARLDDIAFPALAADQSYGRLPDGTGALQLLDAPTPRLPNETEMPDAGPPVDAGCDPPFDTPPAVVVNEALANNGAGQVDPADGQTDPWVELFNAGGVDVPLAGLVLSDDATLSSPWALPATETLAPGDFLLVFFDNQPAQGPLHAGLLLTSLDNAVSLGDVCGTVFHTLDLSDDGTVDVSKGLYPDGDTSAAAVALTPSPATANPAP